VELGAANRAELFCATGSQLAAKQLLPRDPRSDIVRKHPASRFIFTTDHGGQWEPNDEGETEMTSAGVSDVHEIRELTIDELDQGRRRTVDGR